MTNFTLYELVCKDSRIKDKYIGFTSSTEEEFWLNMDGRYYDKTTGELKDSVQPKTPIQLFIEDTGKADNWEFKVLGTYTSRADVNKAKQNRIHKSDEYTINIYHTGAVRQPRESK